MSRIDSLRGVFSRFSLLIMKTIKGEAFISGKSLVQDIILFTDTTQSESTVIIIEDIWEDLKSTSGKAKTDGKGYWYWEVEMTDMEDMDKLFKIKITCPKPGPGLFEYKFEEESGDSDWTKYWKGKMKETYDTLYHTTNALQPKEVTFPGTKYVDQNGNLINVDKVKHTRTDLGDIQNLLFNLY